MLQTVCTSLVAALVLSGCIGSETETSEASRQAIAQAKGAILRADGTEALKLLSEVSENDLSSEDRAFLFCAKGRLSGKDAVLPNGGSNPLVEEILPAFQVYWQQALMEGDDDDQAERKLRLRLFEILNANDPDVIEPMIIERLQSEGLFALMGRTGKLRDLMIWREQSEDIQTVQLPDGEVTTTVFYLDRFISTGWSSYFTCDTTGTAGWAKENGLFVVVPRWKALDDERFRVSFLAHESQHFQDYSNFPDLAGWELEYRAKLVELTLADTDQDRLIERFTANQGEDKSNAHSYANRKILADLRGYLNLAESDHLEFDSKQVIRQAASALLRNDSEQRQQKTAIE